MFTLEGYNLSTKLYQGTKTVVYQAVRTLDQKTVTIKFMNTEYPTATDLNKLRHEYEITKNIHSNRIIKVLELASYGNSLALILEHFGDGQSLKTLISQQPLNLNTFLEIATQLAEILAELHQQHIIHKDIKPSNLIICRETSQVKLTDFGISSFLPHGQTLSHPHILEGTLAYMSPEQTGRMNRIIDYRSDFYSLGITFYEMLVGKLPFQSDDPMELVHSHIAKQPTPPHQLNSDIPPQLSTVVMKLLAKIAEERYQSAYGLKADLQMCLNQLQATGKIGGFVIGYRDVSDKFQIPQKLYGRETEIETLLTVFDKVCQGQSQMMLVSGHSGIGKTLLVQEIYQAIGGQKRGYFTSGQFDQFQRNIPYSAVIKAFENLIKLLLTESESQLQQWQQKLQNALGANAQLIIDVLGEVELIIGKQLPVPTLPPAESQNRFNWVFQNFIKVFTQPEHPLVLFLDNLQWADTASLKLLQHLITAADNHHLFVIGAYRDNEIGAAHPLQLTLDNIQNAGVSVERMSLPPLALLHINQLIADTLNYPLAPTKPLAEIVLAKTQGSPFFVNEFLKSLHAEQLLTFVPPTEQRIFGWHWDLVKIQAREITDNVVELLAAQIQRLSKNTQYILQLAACIGHQFLLETLIAVSEKQPTETLNLLQEAVTAGLVFPLNSMVLTTEYKFAHERIQQATGSLISEESRQKIHTLVGQRLLQNTPPEQLTEQIFAIVNHLNLGQRFIISKEKRNELAQLNRMAGQKAKASAAYEQAYKYLLIGIDLLAENSWRHQYDFTLALTVEAAELAALNGDFDKTESLIEAVLQNAKSLLEKVKAYEIRMQAYKAQNQLQETITIGLAVLAQLGVKFPNAPTKWDFSLGSITTKLALAGKNIDNLCDLPTMTQPKMLAAMRIMLSISPPVYTIMPKLLPLIVFKRVKLSIKYGNAYESVPAYASYGYILSGIKEEIERGYQFGQLALRLLEQNQTKELKARIFQIVYGVITHSKEPIQASLQPLLEAYQSGIETGDFESAAMSATNYAIHAYFVGDELTKVEHKLATYAGFFTYLKQETSLSLNHIYRQAILNLTGKTSDSPPLCLIGDVYNEEQMLPLHLEAQAKGLVFQVYYLKMTLCYLFRAYPQAFENATLAEQYLEKVIGSPVVPLFHFYDSLARLAMYPEALPSERRGILDKVEANQKKMNKWAHHASKNYLHKFYLVEAEWARVLRSDSDAREFYDKAIALAQYNEYVNEEALAYELAGQFYLAKGQRKLAYVYLRDAHYAYSRWGATAKVKDLETRYPQILAKKHFSCPFVLPEKPNLSECRDCTHHTTHATHATTSTVSATAHGTATVLDLNSVLKASQAIAGEIMLKRLLSKLMKIVVENAGAQSGFLLINQNGQWRIEAKYIVTGIQENDEPGVQEFKNPEVQQSRSEEHTSKNTGEPAIEVLCSESLETSEELSAGIIHYVARTKEYVVLNDATRVGSFTNDPHILKRQPKSILCVPLLNQGNTMGILYLENNLVTGVFTPKRLEMLHLLTSQIAISIENARLYASLEDKVKERTKDIEAQNTQLIELNEQLLKLNQDKSEFLGIAAHDLKNPLSAIQGLSRMIETDYDEMSKEEVMNLAQMISIVSQQMFELIKNLLDVNQIESGKIKLSLQMLDIKPILQWLLKDYRERAKAKNIQLHFQYQNQAYHAYVDESATRQVLDNLLSNAIKYSPPGKHIYIHLSQQERTLRCAVQDEGPGLTDKDQQQLFGKFSRLTPRPTGDEHSTGLGLFIVKKLVEAMNGRVWCESELGKGTTFIVKFSATI